MYWKSPFSASHWSNLKISHHFPIRNSGPILKRRQFQFEVVPTDPIVWNDGRRDCSPRISGGCAAHYLVFGISSFLLCDGLFLPVDAVVVAVARLVGPMCGAGLCCVICVSADGDSWQCTESENLERSSFIVERGWDTIIYCDGNSWWRNNHSLAGIFNGN